MNRYKEFEESLQSAFQNQGSGNAGNKSQIPSNAEIQIVKLYIKTASSKAYIVNVPSNIQIDLLQKTIRNLSKVEVDNQVLYYSGKLISNCEEQHQKFKNNGIVHLIDRGKIGGDSLDIVIKRVKDVKKGYRKAYRYSVNPDVQIGVFLQQKLNENNQFKDYEQLFLVYVGRSLNKNLTFFQQGVQNGSELYCVHAIQDRVINKKDISKATQPQNSAIEAVQSKNSEPIDLEKRAFISSCKNQKVIERFNDIDVKDAESDEDDQPITSRQRQMENKAKAEEIPNFKKKNENRQAQLLSENLATKITVSPKATNKLKREITSENRGLDLTGNNEKSKASENLLEDNAIPQPQLSIDQNGQNFLKQRQNGSTIGQILQNPNLKEHFSEQLKNQKPDESNDLFLLNQTPYLYDSLQGLDLRNSQNKSSEKSEGSDHKNYEFSPAEKPIAVDLLNFDLKTTQDSSNHDPSLRQSANFQVNFQELVNSVSLTESTELPNLSQSPSPNSKTQQPNNQELFFLKIPMVELIDLSEQTEGQVKNQIRMAENCEMTEKNNLNKSLSFSTIPLESVKKIPRVEESSQQEPNLGPIYQQICMKTVVSSYSESEGSEGHHQTQDKNIDDLKVANKDIHRETVRQFLDRLCASEKVQQGYQSPVIKEKIKTMVIEEQEENEDDDNQLSEADLFGLVSSQYEKMTDEIINKVCDFDEYEVKKSIPSEIPEDAKLKLEDSSNTQRNTSQKRISLIEQEQANDSAAKADRETENNVIQSSEVNETAIRMSCSLLNPPKIKLNGEDFILPEDKVNFPNREDILNFYEGLEATALNSSTKSVNFIKEKTNQQARKRLSVDNKENVRNVAVLQPLNLNEDCESDGNAKVEEQKTIQSSNSIRSKDEGNALNWEAFGKLF